MACKAPIIITGGAQRLGLACVKALVEQDYNVVTTYRTERREITHLKEIGVRCIFADFSTKEGVEEFIAIIKNDYQSIRCIIHNASEWKSEEEISDVNLLMEKMWQIHVSAPYSINLAFETLLCSDFELGRQADIIHMTDYVVEKGSDKHIAYAASKAGLSNLTFSFAKRLAPKVKVNAIAPSLIMFNENDGEEYRQKALKKSLLGTVPGEQEVVSAVQYILNSSHMTGRTLSIDGGRHLV